MVSALLLGVYYRLLNYYRIRLGRGWWTILARWGGDGGRSLDFAGEGMVDDPCIFVGWVIVIVFKSRGLLRVCLVGCLLWIFMASYGSPVGLRTAGFVSCLDAVFLRGSFQHRTLFCFFISNFRLPSHHVLGLEFISPAQWK